MILGVDQMKHFNPIIFDFVNSIVQFHYGDLLIYLRGNVKTDGLKRLTGAGAQKFVQQSKVVEGGTSFLVIETKAE